MTTITRPKIKLSTKTEQLTTPIAPAVAPPVPEEFSSITKLNDYIKELVENNIFFMFIELLQKISKDYTLPFDELKEKYLSYFKKDLHNSNLYCDLLSLNLKNIDFHHIGDQISAPSQSQQTPPITCSEPSETDMNMSDDTKCCVRTASNTRCSRRKQSGFDFCGCHLHSQPFGRVDQPVNTEVIFKRKLKAHTTTEPETTHPTKPSDTPIFYASIKTIDGIDYLVNNETHEIFKIREGLNLQQEINKADLKLVGVESSDGLGLITWYTDRDLIFITK
jgi:hypothetical protein